MTKTVTFTIEVPEDVKDFELRELLEHIIMKFSIRQENPIVDWELSDFMPGNLTIY